MVGDSVFVYKEWGNDIEFVVFVIFGVGMVGMLV